MNLVVVTARVHADNVDAVAAEARKTFAAIAAAVPNAGYAICRGPDGVTFVTVIEDGSPLLSRPEFAEFQAAIRAWGAEPPTSERWQVIDGQGLFGSGNTPVRTQHEDRSSS